jgi:hypothetical protein
MLIIMGLHTLDSLSQFSNPAEILKNGYAIYDRICATKKVYILFLHRLQHIGSETCCYCVHCFPRGQVGYHDGWVLNIWVLMSGYSKQEDTQHVRREKKPSSVRVCLWLSRILYVAGDVQL